MEMNRAGPVALLRQLRKNMAEPLEPQERLDTIVSDIAVNMGSDVCSLYILRADKILELYASRGLKAEAVHKSALRVGEGLVGTIAASAQYLRLDDARSHPAFAYLPETGEEIYHSFLGVPVLRAGRVLGVLVVQDVKPRDYSQAQVEVLETTAMVLGELVATGELDSLSENGGVSLDLARPLQFDGVSMSDGIALGTAVLHEPRVVVTNLFNEDPDHEIARLADALEKVRLSIDVLFQKTGVPSQGEHRDILDAYRMFAHDKGWNRRIEEAVQNGLTAEAAVEKVQNDYRAQMMRQEDPYLRERLNDFDDLANRLMRQLAGKPTSMSEMRKSGDHILIARSMGAAELLDYHSERLRGLVLEEAAPTSHVVIVARALGIPVVGQLIDFVANTEAGNAIIVDGDEGQVFLRPQLDVESAYVEKIRFRASRQKQYLKLKDKPTVSLDGQTVELNINAGLLMDLPQLRLSGADGVGLFRTELQFMVSATLPRPGEQEALYRDVIEGADGRPVTFRALDIGGDKVLPYLKTVQEENPAMGWRALRLSLDRPALLKSQIRALLKAAAGTTLRLMLPMVTEVREVRLVKGLIKRELELQTRFGHKMPEKLELGAMLEVPNLLFQLDELMKEVDFVSVGSNDLYQFMLASDRGNVRLSNRYSGVGKGFLRTLKQIVSVADGHGIDVSLCGEMAGRPLSAMALLGLGYRSISMSPAAIGPVKAMILALDISELRRVLVPALEADSDNTTMLELLTDFADRHGIPY